MDSNSFTTYSEIYVEVIKVDERVYNVEYVIDNFVGQFEEYRFTFSTFDKEEDAEKYTDSLKYIVDAAHFKFEIM